MNFSMLHHPRVALALLGLLMLLPAPLLWHLELDNAPEAYFPADAPAVVFDREVREAFPQEQVLVALFEGEALFTPRFLEGFHRLSQTLERINAVERVLGVTSTDHIRPIEGGFAVERLIPVNQLADGPPEAWQTRALDDPFAPDLLISRDGRALALVVRPHALDNSLQRLNLERAVREAIDHHQLSDELTAVGGHIALDVAQLRAMTGDLALLIPGTLGIGLMLLWWLFRRHLVLILATVTISAVTGLAVGLLAVLGKPFTLITAIVPPLLTALTVAMLMHLFNAVAHYARRGLTGAARLEAALASVRRPIGFMALTTAAGLASLGVSPIQPVGSFGLIAAAGIIVAALCVLGLLPPLILRFDRGTWHQRGALPRLDRWTAATTRLAVRRTGWVLAGAVLLFALALPQIRHVTVETDLYAFFADDHPISRATARIETRLSGVMPLEVVFRAEAPDALTKPERLRAIQDVQAWLDDRPEVDYSLSLPDLVAEMHWAFHDGDPDYRGLPDDHRLIAQYLFIHDGRDLFDVVDPELRQARLLLNLNAHGARALNTLIDDFEAHLATNPPADLEWDLAGMGRLFADQERLLIQGQLHSLLAVVVLIFGLMWLMWRSVRLATLSMLPNLAPLALIFALMGLLGIWLDMATAMIASVAVGIAVDDTIHLLHGYLRRRRAGASAVWAVARSSRQAGRAVTATTVVLVGQFLLVGLSDFQPTQAFGLLTAFGLLIAWLVDLVVLPALLIALSHRRARPRG